MWATYDWKKVTAVVPFDGQMTTSTDLQQLYCEAHRSGARVLDWTSCGPTECCPVDEFYGWLRSKDKKSLNQTIVTSWAKSTAACIKRAGLDGVLLDLEDVGAHIWPGVDAMSAIKFGVCELRRALNATLPGSLLIWTTMDSRLANYGQLAVDGCVDFYLEMQYASCRGEETHSLSVNRATAPLGAVNTTISRYLSNCTNCTFDWYPDAYVGGFGIPPWNSG